VIRARLFSVYVHQVILGGRGVARVERRERTVFVLEDEARDVRVVAGKDQLREPAAHRLDRTQEILEHVAVMNADLEHHPARHPARRIPPRIQVDLPEPIAADVRFSVDELAEFARVDALADPAEMALTPALVAEREHYFRLAAGLRDRPSLRDGI